MLKMVPVGKFRLHLNIYINVIACDNKHVCLEKTSLCRNKIDFLLLVSLVGFFRNAGRNPIKNLRFVLSSYAILERDIMMKKSSINISISILIPILLMIFFINVKYRIILTALFGASIFSTTFLCTIGFILAVLSYIENKNIWAKIGIMLNVLVFFIPIIWIFWM
ncbi:hypothetical protein ACTJJY_30630 [Bacillus sp. 22475]|uniref:hypothetical protein n=1 Tax=Bacillus sp. 22475 TaxID=3453925 RepID=UPI003F856335